MAAGLRPDPLGELTVLPRFPSCIQRVGIRTKERERGKTGGDGDRGGRAQTKDERDERGEKIKGRGRGRAGRRRGRKGKEKFRRHGHF